MASKTALNGATRAGGGGAGGGISSNIFENIKFWISFRVPERKKMVELVRDHGGHVVDLETNATMRIDRDWRNVSNEVPSLAFSPAFITDSVSHGALQVEDKYCLRPEPTIPRAPGSGSLRRTRVPFTTADDAELARWILLNKTDLRGDRIYQDLERVNSRHTWQSWKNRYTKTLMPRVQSSQSYLRRLAGMAEDPNVPSQRSNPPPNEVAVNQARERQTAAVANANKAQSTPDHNPAPTTASEGTRAPEVRQPPTENNVPEESTITRSTNDVRGESASPPTDAAPTEDDAIPEESAHVEGEATTEEDSDMINRRNEFYSDFRNYLVAVDAEIDLNHRIGDRDLELWDLFVATTAQDVPREELDWVTVAGDLGYDWFRDEHVVDNLRKCYEDHLDGFLDYMCSYSSGGEEEVDETEQQGAEVEDATLQPPAEQPSSPRHAAASPPIGNASRKRPLETQPSSSGRSSKRMRLSRDAVVPATPDCRIGLGERRLRSQTPSPGVRSSAVFHDVPIDMDDDDYDDDDDGEDAQELPSLPEPANETNPEASSQDDPFKTPTRRPARQSLDNPVDITPSQQLRSEAHVESPDPPKRPQHSILKRQLPWQTSGPSRQPPPLPLEEEEGSIEPSSKEVRSDENWRQIDSWVALYESKGYARHIVEKALWCTSMTAGETAEKVMQSLKDGQGIPTHHEGVWTERDDASLRLVDSAEASQQPANPEEEQRKKKAAKEWTRLEGKHGVERIELRRRFLEAKAALNKEKTT